MAENVLELKKKNPDETLVHLLEQLLGEAKAGNLTAFAGIGRIDDQYATFFNKRIFDDAFSSLGHLRVLQMQVERGVELPPDE